MNQQSINQKTYYTTQNLALAATLYLWHPLEGIVRKDPRKVDFQFPQNQDIDKLVDSFWRKEVKVEPLSYFEALKVLKSRIYGDR